MNTKLTLSFCQATRDLPNDIKQVIRKLSTELTFTDWMGEIDHNLVSMIGQTVSDLPDEPFTDFYEEGMTPLQVAETMIEHNTMLFF
jgi:hypothetical protein